MSGRIEMRKAISLFLVFSILALSMPLTAKERKGADLIVQRTDGTQVRGELIAVKQSSLLLMERDSGADVTVDIEEISVITIAKKWKAGNGFLIGSIVGAVSGAGFAAYMMANPIFGKSEFQVGGLIGATLISGLVVGVIGILISGLSSKDKIIQFEGMSDSEIQEILEKLRKKARVRNAQ
jgi:hypothetical protein